MQRNISPAKLGAYQEHTNKDNSVYNNLNSIHNPDEYRGTIPIRLRSLKKVDNISISGNDRKANSNYKPLNFIERDFTNGDTLQSVALKYNCNIGELKRINNIQLDNEAFCKGKIKIPLNVYNISIIEKEKEDILKDIQIKKHKLKLCLNQEAKGDFQSAFLIDVNNDSNVTNAKTPAEEYLENVDASVNFYSQKLSPYTNTDTNYPTSLSNEPYEDCEEMQENSLLLNSSNNILLDPLKIYYSSASTINPRNSLQKQANINDKTSDKFFCLPSECGMKLWILLLLIVLVCIAVPIMVLWHFVNIHNQENDGV